MEKYLGEFLGTMVLMVFGNGIGASISLNKSLAKGFAPNWFTVVFGWGLAVTLGVYTAGFYNTGGHLNPAVTIAFAVGASGGLYHRSDSRGFCRSGYCSALLLSPFQRNQGRRRQLSWRICYWTSHPKSSI